jgi:hypothetical protein
MGPAFQSSSRLHIATIVFDHSSYLVGFLDSYLLFGNSLQPSGNDLWANYHLIDVDRELLKGWQGASRI